MDGRRHRFYRRGSKVDATPHINGADGASRGWQDRRDRRVAGVTLSGHGEVGVPDGSVEARPGGHEGVEV